MPYLLSGRLFDAASRSYRSGANLARTAVAICLFGLVAVSSAQKQPLSPAAQQKVLQQIQELNALKAKRTATQRKIDANLLATRDMVLGRRLTPSIQRLNTGITPDSKGRVVVDIEAKVTRQLLAKIVALGGTIRSAVPRFNAIRALVPLSQLEAIASDPAVRFIDREQIAVTNVVTSEGDKAMAANVARGAFGLSGTGVKIGVLSDGVMSLSASQTASELPAVQVLAGQEGPSTGDEGTAMLEIVHDLAPSSPLAYATAFNGVASYAQNILDLYSAGCKVIVDDVMYLTEPCFQDGPIAQAVNTVAANGGMYFSAIGNQGRLSANTSGVWEGDYKDSGNGFSDGSAKFAAFDGGTTWYNQIVDDGNGGGGQYVQLQWSDALGKSSNDYDLYIINSGGTILASSTNTQSGSQNPVELCVGATGQFIVIAKKTAAAARFLHTNVFRGVLTTRTNGDAFGHATTPGAFGIAAVNASGMTTRFTSANGIELFSSNGPRKMFYYADGTAITPGNFLKAGGVNLAKPDFAAADGVKTSVSGFNPFYGTSAAAPHAAAVAALLLEHNPSHTRTSLYNLFDATSIDLAPAGWDVDSGNGTILADVASLKSMFDSYSGFKLNPESVPVGQTSTATISLSVAAPPSGLTFNLSSNNTALATVPAQATVPAGSKTKSFTVTTKGTVAGSAVISAELFSGGPVRQATLTVTAGSTLAVESITFDKKPYTGGTPLNGTVTLDGNAPTGGVVVNLTSSNTAAATVPASVTVAAGTSSKSFAITGKVQTSDKTTTITATPAGGTGFSQNLRVKAPYPIGITRRPATVYGGLPVNGTVTISGPAPAGGWAVAIATDNASATVASPVTVAAGATTANFTINTVPVATTVIVKITCTANGASYSRNFTLAKPALAALKLPATSVKGGTVITGNVVLTSLAPTAGVTVSLLSSDTAVGTVPSTVKVLAGKKKVAFSVTTKTVTSNKNVTVTGKLAGSADKTVTLTVTP